MISVCIASYNGEEFIGRQLESILPQLDSQDEVIIVDDCSTDKTSKVIEQLADSRISLYVSSENNGPMASFQKALTKASGDFIFLCDQDDIWHDNKVGLLSKALIEESADLVVHDAEVVTGDLELINPSWNAYNSNDLSQGILGNIKKNAYTGCMMAFTKELRDAVIPFPTTIEMHDQWIGLVALMTKKKIVLIDQPLMTYIRHGGNVTAIKKRSALVKIKGRLGTISAIIKFKLDKNKVGVKK